MITGMIIVSESPMDTANVRKVFPASDWKNDFMTIPPVKNNNNNLSYY
jgi:hypothetical protein